MQRPLFDFLLQVQQGSRKCRLASELRKTQILAKSLTVAHSKAEFLEAHLGVIYLVPDLSTFCCPGGEEW